MIGIWWLDVEERGSLSVGLLPRGREKRDYSVLLQTQPPVPLFIQVAKLGLQPSLRCPQLVPRSGLLGASVVQ